MLTNNYISIKEVIRNIYRNTGRDDSFNVEDAAYWVYEAMENIGYPLTYIPKIAGMNSEEQLTFDNYKIQLPDDFHKLLAIAVNGVTAIPSSDLFSKFINSTCCGFESLASQIDGYYDNFGTFFSPNALPLNTNSYNTLTNVTFTINESYITFNVKEGSVCLVYLAYPMDSEGFPKIPDAHVFKEACAAYVQERLDYIDWRKQLISDKIYDDSKRERNFSIAKARNESKMPSVQEMESLKNQSLKMIVRINEFESNFNNLSQRGIKGRY